MIDAVIFDMDGLLIDSEPLWRIAETRAMNAIGVPMEEDDGFLTMGLRTDEVVEFWYARHPWAEPSKREVEGAIVGNVIALIEERGTALPGAVQAVRTVRDAGYRVGLASSSAMEIIEAVLTRIELRDGFDVLQSAEHEPYGKPHPAVYIECARQLGVVPDRCLALEDSPAGVLAAKAAKMRCIAIPPPELQDDHRYCIADLQLESIEQFSIDTVRTLAGV
ncbi:MAG: hexitol phosphatase HxpB [Thermomicrobiales bacterium]|nr:hexitol phosphatase HxpB [Thermomicrobiales bacterium]MCO5222218.1 hexitol phosphatase HxpB [Thermomicrobiales bacterium]